MAKKTFQQINFVTGAVYGTLAYDFDAPGYYQEEEEEVVSVPKRRRAARTDGQEWVREEQRAREASRASNAALQLGRVMSVISALGSVAAVVLLVLVLLAKIQLIGISSQALKWENQIAELESQHSRLTVQYEQVFNLKDVEQAATDVLGMQEAREEQIYYLTGVSSADKAVVITHQDAGMFSLGIEDIIDSARSYLNTLTK